jgi:hypothetical protein
MPTTLTTLDVIETRNSARYRDDPQYRAAFESLVKAQIEAGQRFAHRLDDHPGPVNISAVMAYNGLTKG